MTRSIPLDEAARIDAGQATITAIRAMRLDDGFCLVRVDTDAGISGYGEFQSQVEAGALRVLGVSAPERIAIVDAPTFKEGGVDLSVQNWRGIWAGPGLSAEQVAAITADVEKTVNSESWKKVLEAKGWMNTWLAGDDFKAQLATEIENTTAILKEIGLVS